MSVHEPPSTFELAVQDHLDAAHNLARWLTRNDQDAQDVVQDSCMKAMRAFDSMRGGDFRVWFLTIVRNTSFTWLRQNNRMRGAAAGQSLEMSAEIAADQQQYDPQAIAIRAANVSLVRSAINELPDALRETLVLREMEGLSYKEIGNITEVPIGTVMSRLARARTRLHTLLMEADPSEGRPSAQESTQ